MEDYNWNTQLRIGNWIHDAAGGITQVYGLGKGLIWIREEGGATQWEFKPIHITEEWLKSLGIYISDVEHVSRGEAYISNGKFHFVLHAEFNEITAEYQGTDIIIEYVHQLQNLIFALTGEELLYKP